MKKAQIYQKTINTHAHLRTHTLKQPEVVFSRTTNLLCSHAKTHLLLFVPVIKLLQGKLRLCRILEIYPPKCAGNEHNICRFPSEGNDGAVLGFICSVGVAYGSARESSSIQVKRSAAIFT